MSSVPSGGLSLLMDPSAAMCSSNPSSPHRPPAIDMSLDDVVVAKGGSKACAASGQSPPESSQEHGSSGGDACTGNDAEAVSTPVTTVRRSPRVRAQSGNQGDRKSAGDPLTVERITLSYLWKHGHIHIDDELWFRSSKVLVKHGAWLEHEGAQTSHPNLLTWLAHVIRAGSPVHMSDVDTTSEAPNFRLVRVVRAQDDSSCGSKEGTQDEGSDGDATQRLYTLHDVALEAVKANLARAAEVKQRRLRSRPTRKASRAQPQGKPSARALQYDFHGSSSNSSIGDDSSSGSTSGDDNDNSSNDEGSDEQVRRHGAIHSQNHDHEAEEASDSPLSLTPTFVGKGASFLVNSPSASIDPVTAPTDAVMGTEPLPPTERVSLSATGSNVHRLERSGRGSAVVLSLQRASSPPMVDTSDGVVLVADSQGLGSSGLSSTSHPDKGVEVSERQESEAVAGTPSSFLPTTSSRHDTSGSSSVAKQLEHAWQSPITYPSVVLSTRSSTTIGAGGTEAVDLVLSRAPQSSRSRHRRAARPVESAEGSKQVKDAGGGGGGTRSGNASTDALMVDDIDDWDGEPAGNDADDTVTAASAVEDVLVLPSPPPEKRRLSKKDKKRKKRERRREKARKKAEQAAKLVSPKKESRTKAPPERTDGGDHLSTTTPPPTGKASLRPTAPNDPNPFMEWATKRKTPRRDRTLRSPVQSPISVRSRSATSTASTVEDAKLALSPTKKAYREIRATEHLLAQTEPSLSHAALELDSCPSLSPHDDALGVLTSLEPASPSKKSSPHAYRSDVHMEDALNVFVQPSSDTEPDGGSVSPHAGRVQSGDVQPSNWMKQLLNDADDVPHGGNVPHDAAAAAVAHASPLKARTRGGTGTEHGVPVQPMLADACNVHTNDASALLPSPVSFPTNALVDDDEETQVPDSIHPRHQSHASKHVSGDSPKKNMSLGGNMAGPLDAYVIRTSSISQDKKVVVAEEAASEEAHQGRGSMATIVKKEPKKKKSKKGTKKRKKQKKGKQKSGSEAATKKRSRSRQASLTEGDASNLVGDAHVSSALESPSPSKRSRQVTQGASPRSGGPGGPAMRRVVLCSGLNGSQLRRVDFVCKHLGRANVLPSYDLQQDGGRMPTHLVTSSSMDQGRRATKRKLKYILAIVCGCWVVDIAWIEACMEHQTWVGEEEYEIDCDTVGNVGGPRRSRLSWCSKEGPSMCVPRVPVSLPWGHCRTLLHGFSVYVHHTFAGVLDRATVALLAHRCGAHVMTTLLGSTTQTASKRATEPGSGPGDLVPCEDLPSHVLTQLHSSASGHQSRSSVVLLVPVHTEASTAEQLFRVSRGVEPVKVDWLLSCIGQWKALAPTDFHVRPQKEWFTQHSLEV